MSDDFFEGGSTSGLHPARNLVRNVAPSFEGDSSKNTIRVPLQPIACWRMNYALFGFDSSAVRPELAAELPALAELAAANPDAPITIFGHADPTGKDDYNKTLAGRRARAIYALLVRDPTIWEALFSDPIGGDKWGLASTQMMLATLSDAEGAPYYVGPEDGKFSPASRGAIEHYQRDTPGLKVDGIAGPATRKKLYTAYMETVCVGSDGPFVLAKPRFLGGGAEADDKAAYQGCGEANPVLIASKEHAAGPSRDAVNAPNRRVMVFFFPPGTTSKGWPCPTWKEGPSGCTARFWPDADARRKATEVDRAYRSDLHTMACRFYDRLARVSPCEGRGRSSGPPLPDPVDPDGDYPFSL